jgi:WD40 repeat protein
LIRTYDGHRGRLTQLVGLGTTTIASAAIDDTVRIWDVDRFAQIGVITDVGHVRCLAYSPRHKLLACAGDDRALSFWMSDSGEVKTVSDAHDAAIVSCGFHDGTWSWISLDQDG